MTLLVVRKKFSCDDLSSRCFTSFAELRSEKQLCDFTLNVGELSISAHRVILAAAIPYYRNMFSKGTDEVLDVEPNTLACLIDYAYTHEISIDANNVKSVLAAARQLGIDEVKQACCDFLSDLEQGTVSNDPYSGSRFEETSCDIGDNLNVMCETDPLNHPVTNFKDLSSNEDQNVEQKEVSDDVLCFVEISPKGLKDDLLELQSKSRMRLKELLCLGNIEDMDSFSKRKQVTYSSIIQPKRKEDCASNENIQNPCIYKLNVEEIYTVQCFNPLQEEWITEIPEVFFTFSGSAVTLQNMMYFFRFFSTLQYDPRYNSFRSMSCMPAFKDFFGATTLGNRIFICGGRIGNSTVTNAVDCFHPTTNTWETVTSMSARRFCLSAVTIDECIFAIGGKCENTVYRTVEKYNSRNDEWTSTAPMLENRSAAGAATLNGRIYVCGGTSLNGDAVSSCEMYYPNDDAWIRISPLNSTRCYFTLLSFKRKLHAIGGWSNENTIHRFDIYNPVYNTWTFGPSTDREYLTSTAFVLPRVHA